MAVCETITPTGAAPWHPPGVWLLEIIDNDNAPGLRPGDFVEVDGDHRLPSPPGMYVLAAVDRDGTERLIVRRLDYVMTSKPPMVVVTCDSGCEPDRLVPLSTLDIRGRCISAFLRLGPNGELRSMGVQS